MVTIENVDLRARGVELPSDRIGVVVAQPFLWLTPKEPFVCTPETAGTQLATIQQTLEIAKARPHGQAKTHFTIFPEYTIPGLVGAAAVDAAVGAADWPNRTVVIGGLTALTRDEYVALSTMPRTTVNAAANGSDRVKANEWLNCSVVWVKSADGAVEKWVQPKLYPAWTEQKVHYKNMFHGGSIFIFRGRLENGALYRFSTLVCFDWIATVDNALLWRRVLEDLAKQAEVAEADYSLSWFFVIQHNEKPNHDAFLSQIPPFFDERSLPIVRRDRACVVFANSAGKPAPGKTDRYGGTSLVFSATTNFTKAECSPTFSSGGPRFRDNSTTLNPYYDVVFRERGACILSFVQVNPGAVAAGAANRTIAVENAELFPIGATVDPRVPSAAVPASVKWLNDQLDDLPSVAAILLTAPLKSYAAVAHDATVTALRATDAGAIADALALATDAGVEHADTWDDGEAAALSLLVNATEILAIGFASQPMTVGSPLSTITIGGHTLAVVTVKGRSHQSCLEHAGAHLPNTPHQCLLITRDQENTGWDRKEENFLKGETPHLGMEKKITDPDNNALHLSYQDLLTVYRKAKTVNALQEAIHAKLS
jgi:hypothetical protein